MRVLKYAILGLLRKGELSGYDITSYFKEEPRPVLERQAQPDLP